MPNWVTEKVSSLFLWTKITVLRSTVYSYSNLHHSSICVEHIDYIYKVHDELTIHRDPANTTCPALILEQQISAVPWIS